MNELSELPDINTLERALPSMDGNGNLPVGDYAPSESEFMNRLVATDNPEKRGEIYEGWLRHGEALRNAGLSYQARQLLNGSYTTSKALPGDIDIAVEVATDKDVPEFVIENPTIMSLLQGPSMKMEYHCDAYPILVLPKTHPNYETVTVAAIKYWSKWFGRDRENREKGRVWALTGTHP